MEMFTKKAVFPGEGGELSQMDKIYNALGTPTKTEWPDLVEMPWFHLMRPTERRKRVFEDVYRDVLTTGAMDLISSIFRYDPSQRPSAEDVLKHPYFVSEEPAPHPPIEYVSYAPLCILFLLTLSTDWSMLKATGMNLNLKHSVRKLDALSTRIKRTATSARPTRQYPAPIEIRSEPSKIQVIVSLASDDLQIIIFSFLIAVLLHRTWLVEWFAFTFHEIHPWYSGFFRACSFFFFCHILPTDQRKFRSKLLFVWRDIIIDCILCTMCSFG
jgi:serine/threonine protein kinase